MLKKPTVGYVGLGAMGRRMLTRLSASDGLGQCFGFDIDSVTTGEVCEEAGATACGSLAEIAGRSDILFTCLPNNAIVRAAFLDDGGIVSAIRGGTITIDCSTIGPEVTEEVYKAVRQSGGSHLDASMLGSTKQAEEGTISFVVGGDAAALEASRPALEAVGQLIRHCGGPGMGNRMKLLHQTMVAGHAMLTGEALAIGERLGIDLDLFYEIVTQGTGLAYSRFFDQRAPRIRAGEFSPMFMLSLMAKDARLAREMLPDDQGGDGLRGLKATIATLVEAENLGFGDDDFSAVYKVPKNKLD